MTRFSRLASPPSSRVSEPDDPPAPKPQHSLGLPALGDGGFLVLGGAINLPQVLWHRDPALPCSVVLLAGKVSAADLAAATDCMPDPAVPIADFADNRGTRHDFAAQVLDGPTLDIALAQFAPIRRRLAEVPFRATRQDRGDMLILRLAYSRDRSIEARFAPDTASVIDYPLIACSTPKRVELEGLAFRDLLRRRHFVRTHACERCASNRLLAFEACTACGSSDLVDEPIVHHYRCGCQQAESGFVGAQGLVCPKCRQALRHFGVDYGKPGMVVHCRSCGATSPEPDPRFACLDCAAIFSGQQAAAIDWFHYDLTDAGMLALRTGRLPDDIDMVQPAGMRAPRSIKEFRLLATAALRTARRFTRPFTLAKLSPTSLNALRGKYGATRVEEAVQQASITVATALSDSEIVATADDAILIGFPETPASKASSLIDGARAAMTAGAELEFEFDVSLYEGDDAGELLGRY